MRESSAGFLNVWLSDRWGSKAERLEPGTLVTLVLFFMVSYTQSFKALKQNTPSELG